VISIGTDILAVQRIEAVQKRLGDKFMRRILTATEQEEYRDAALPNRLLAKRFAAKEAVAKALGTGIGRGVSWQDIEIGHDSHGSPLVHLRGGALAVAAELGGSRVALSLSDEADYVVAFAVLDR
jgi:holo-[acyl-carrier protein] synthase